MNRRVVRRLHILVFSVAVGLLFAMPAKADDAAALFKGKCAGCHGADGKGDTSMGKMFKLRDFGSVDVQKQTDAQLTDIITNGKEKMPAYKGKLTDDQIKQIVAFIRSLKK
jgi:cytochrome c6